MIKVSCDKGDLNFEVLEGRPLEICSELQEITIEAIRLMTENQPDDIKKMMADMYTETLKEILEDVLN